MNWISGICVILVAFIARSECFDPWSYECDEFSRCIKTDISTQIPDGETALGLQECLLTCQEYALFWPRPRTLDSSNKQIIPIIIESIQLANPDEIPDFLKNAFDDHLENIKLRLPKNKKLGSLDKSGAKLKIVANVEDKAQNPRITIDTDESYILDIVYDPDENVVTGTANAPTAYGTRHAFETFFQAIDYDDVRSNFIILSDIHIEDEPEFPHRGISLDTSRNFMTVDTIKRIINGMAAVKMNVFHWHMTDTHSFPIELTGEITSEMTQYGAYDEQSIYTKADMADVLGYANERGIRVIPEIDQPAHVGYGWNFPGAETYTVCTGIEPWYSYCVEPPCGQLNPAEPKIYDQLEAIYEELYEIFQFDTFHMGADEVNFACWNSSTDIVDYMVEKGWEDDTEGFISLWKEFQDLSSARVRSASSEDVQLIVWTSDLTNAENLDNLPPEDYTVQIWTDGRDLNDETISVLADGGYRMIFSNYDASYLDCGYGAWIGKGNNWCSPYKGWQLQYDNDLYGMLEDRGFDTTDSAIRDLVLGGETAMWSEQVDSETVDGKLFPRTAALAERLWSNPESGWYDAETRMIEMRRRLTQFGINADRLQPEWCRQNSGQCYDSGDNPHNEPSTTTDEDGGTTTDGAKAVVASLASGLAVFSMLMLI